MTTTEPVKPTTKPNDTNKADPAANVASEAKTQADLKPAAVTLEQLAREMNMPPRDARMVLRLAAKQNKLYPTLGKDHVARQPWQWKPGSEPLNEARKALTASMASA